MGQSVHKYIATKNDCKSLAYLIGDNYYYILFESEQLVLTCSPLSLVNYHPKPLSNNNSSTHYCRSEYSGNSSALTSELHSS